MSTSRVKEGRGRRAVVAMSGGVDSSVAAALLAEQGYEVIGVTMRLFDAPFENAGRLNRSCCSLEDVEDARATCRIIGARHYYMNFVEEFRTHVIDYFVGEYERGRTPHPCLACNDRLKFDFLVKRADLMDADVVATGHYARIMKRSDRSLGLARAVDRLKDQAYVLHTLRQEQLARLRLPVGGFTKSEIREQAVRLGLPVADKPDSQDICFIPSGNYREFVARRVGTPVPGVVRTADGAVLGNHDGVHGFTIGQRKGLPLNGGTGKPVFVTHINAATGDVTVGSAKDLLRRRVWVSGVNWISERPDGPVRCEARIRYNGRNADATVTPLGEWARLEFDEPVRAVTPGQAAVFYDGEFVMGGGLIEPAPPQEPVVAAPGAGDEAIAGSPLPAPASAR